MNLKNCVCAAAVMSALSGSVAFAQVNLLKPTDAIVGVAAAPGSTASALAVVGTVAAANNYPAAETPGRAIDGNTATKYLNFAKVNTGFIVTLGLEGSPGIATGFRFTTANDAPARDPISISIEGANAANPNDAATGPTTWTSIYSGASGLATDPGRLTLGSGISFENSLGFNTYRVLVTGVRDAAAANSTQFSEFQLTGTAIPEPGTFTLMGLAGLGWLMFRRRK